MNNQLLFLMINFFRKIRKKLIANNKPLKYMSYAIGEIMLVVVGILIALQINNWNETQKSKELFRVSTLQVQNFGGIRRIKGMLLIQMLRRDVNLLKLEDV